MKFIYLVITLTLSFLLSTTLFAEQKQFCDSYDSHFTKMDATDAHLAEYTGIPKRINDAEFNKIPKKWDHFCPPCTLTDKTQCAARPCQEYNLLPGLVYKGIEAEGDKWMRMASEEALKSVKSGDGPFGAVIVQVDDDTGKIIRYWTNHNHVTEWNDPTAHAEVITIRSVAKELGVLNLGHISQKDSKLPQPGKWSHCIIYSSAEPCPMCLSAIYWAGIKKLVFAATRFDAAVKGVDFSDEMIYQELTRPYIKRRYMEVVHANVDNSLDAFNYYKRSPVPRYGAAP